MSQISFSQFFVPFNFNLICKVSFLKKKTYDDIRFNNSRGEIKEINRKKVTLLNLCHTTHLYICFNRFFFFSFFVNWTITMISNSFGSDGGYNQFCLKDVSERWKKSLVVRRNKVKKKSFSFEQPFYVVSQPSRVYCDNDDNNILYYLVIF